MLPDVFSAYCDRLKIQSSPLTPCPPPTQHCSSHPGHTGWSSKGAQLNMRDVKERPSRSDLTTDTTGAYGGSCMVDPLSASSFPLKLSQQSLSRKSVRSIGPEHTSMNVQSHNEAQSGTRIQLRTSHSIRTPDQSSMVSNPLWEMAKMSAVHTSAEVSSSIQSQHQKGSADNAEKSACVLAPGLDLHSDVVPTSEPVIDVKGSCDLPLPHQKVFQSQNLKNVTQLLDDDDDAHSDLTYQSSTTSGSTTRNPTTEDSRNSSLSQALHPPIAGMQPRTSSPLTASHPVTLALATAGSGKMTLFADMHAAVGPQFNATGDEQSQTSGHPAFLGIQPRTASLTPAVATAGCDEMTSFVDMHTAIGPHSNVTGDKQPQNSDQSAQAHVSSCERQLSAHRSQQPTTHPNPSVNVPSHLEPAVVWLLTSKVPSMINTSAETYPSAATVVEAAHVADTAGAPASSSPAEQPLAVSCKVGSSAVPSTLPDVHQQDSGYSGSHHFVSSNILHRHLGSMEPSDRMPMDSCQRGQDSKGV